MSALKRILSIITNECLLDNIEQEYIASGCQYATYEFEMNKNFSAAISDGVAIAKKCQHSARTSSISSTI